MDEIILKEILEEIKKLNNNLSAQKIDAPMHPKPNLAQHIVGALYAINKTLISLGKSLSSGQEK